MRNLSQHADRLADRWRGISGRTLSDAERAELRDWIDTATAGDLDCKPLDILTDMVAARIAKRPAV